ncbi:uroporphyrinogen-III C-methyltransferase [Paucibacter sp. APW11]|uniref:uroporphyrinogen-III C-methyltransferase n=1 Tax=Roseateles aquae TaxID=3077235 RepID=A0ABU3P6X6_9BURK|nr:uroporphyrinogen-III C-methyltransferase [Paucibacter sp. APW11]MDT8998047.1 uroporphyrinogen-III C-methyltransferase [Paucibacter sp. APW11]
MSRLDEPRFFNSPSVMLVGAGPGDPELLTLKAARALAEARLVLYDALVSPAVLALCPAEAELIYVGKQSGHHHMSQEAIIELMISLVRQGRSLLRLKGGDPFIFGRGGEEAEALAAAGIPFSCIPGISAAQAAAAGAGIPLTHRDHAGALVFATGHLRANDQAGADGAAAHCVDLDWPLLARPHQTVVIYMGLGALEIISAQLIAHGLAADTPAAVIASASQPEQRCLRERLDRLPALVRQAAVRSPALLLIGQVAALHERLWPSLAQAREDAHCKV